MGLRHRYWTQFAAVVNRKNAVKIPKLFGTNNGEGSV